MKQLREKCKKPTFFQDAGSLRMIKAQNFVVYKVFMQPIPP